MIDLVSIWNMEHANFTRLLDLLEKELATFHAGGQPNYDLMLDVVYYLRTYADEVHHPQEEVVFTRLVKRDPKMKPQIELLRQEHRVIAAAGEQLLRHLDDVVAGAVEPRSIVEASAATYLVYYRQHLAAEDKEVVPRAAQLLTQKDWVAAAAVSTKTDPLFGEEIEARFRKLRRQIALEA